MNYESNTDDVLRRARHSIIVAVSAFSVVMVAGTLGYKHFAGADASWLDATYMTFLMVATIGYGAGVDIYHQPERELFTMAIAFSGIGIMTYFFSSVTALVLASDFDKSMRRRRMDKMMRKVNGHYILCGFGRVGRNVAAELEATNHHYVAIDENAELLEGYAEKKPGMLYLQGDASDDDLLISANLEQAKGVFAVTGDDSRNLMISLTAKQINPAARVVARCNDLRNVERCARPAPTPSSRPTSPAACASRRRCCGPMSCLFSTKCCAPYISCASRKWWCRPILRRGHWETCTGCAATTMCCWQCAPAAAGSSIHAAISSCSRDSR